MMESNPTDLTSLSESAAMQQALMEEQQGRERQDIEWLMSSQGGRRIMWGLLTKAGVFKSSFTGDNGTFFNEGQRNLGLMYLNLMMEACPALYATMAEEAAAPRKESDAS